MRPDWNIYFMMIAKLVALRSNCNSRPNGAVIVKDKRILATGYNGSLPGHEQCCDKGSDYCYRREIKREGVNGYDICPAIHAEENAIAQAAKMGIQINDGIMYCTLSPCLICAKSIKASGINKVYYELEYESSDKERDKQWMEFNKNELHSEQIFIHENTRSLFAENCMIITSERRL